MMTNVVPFERKRSGYKDTYTVDMKPSVSYKVFEETEIKRAYSILEGIAFLSTSNHLKNDINCVLGYMRDELKCLRDDPSLK